MGPRIGRVVTELNVIDGGDALTIAASQRSSLLRGIFQAVISGFVVAMLVTQFGGRPRWITPSIWPIGVGLLAALVVCALELRIRKVELEVTRLELESRGRVGDAFQKSRQLRTADIDWLEYQEDRSGPENASHPKGLYAVCAASSVCLLPEIDEEQAVFVIEKIGDKFPGLRKQWSGKSWFGQHFTTLGLDEPN